MNPKRTYSKEEISKILARASKIQTRKDLYGDSQGLTKEELKHIAEEVGIDKDSLLEAIQTSELPAFDSNFNWITATSKVQDVQLVDGEISEEEWEDVVQEIRRVTGGIGKPNKVGRSFEWEQRLKEVGYKHISLTPQNGSTKIQFVSNWRGLKIISTFLPFILGFALSSIFLDGSTLPEMTRILIALFGASLGLGLGRIYLKNYFEKQKSQFLGIVSAINKRLAPNSPPEVSIDEPNHQQESTRTARKGKREKS